MGTPRVTVVGAGIAGLVAALELANAGLAVTVLERQVAPGGKMRQIPIGEHLIDAGPTVFTMRWVFDQIFDDVGERLDDHLKLTPLELLARHAWSEDERLDLFADIDQSADAIGAFAGRAEADGYRSFCARARNIYQTLEGPFIRAPKPTPVSLAWDAGLSGLADLWRISPFATLWQALDEHFRDPRLRQLFGRYATYCGSSPFLAPATLMLVAHVEQCGVWTIEGGMHSLAKALAQLAQSRGAVIRYGCGVKSVVTRHGSACAVQLDSGEMIETDAVLLNADAAAVARGLFGASIASAIPPVSPSTRSLSALTFAMTARTGGFPLSRHNVFFSHDYWREFDDIFVGRRLPSEPTVYVCAQDRDCSPDCETLTPERLLVLVNAPADGDTHAYSQAEIQSCATRTFAAMQRCGLSIDREGSQMVPTAPDDFHRLFPGTGGALYGAASHGWAASFSRPAAKTRIPGLYLAGGSIHPGPGVPMAALSGWMAAAHIVADQTSRKR